MGMVRDTDGVTQMQEGLKTGRNEKSDDSICAPIVCRGKEVQVSVLYERSKSVVKNEGEMCEDKSDQLLLICNTDTSKVSRLLGWP